MSNANADSTRQRNFKTSKRKSLEEKFPEIVDYFFNQIYF